MNEINIPTRISVRVPLSVRPFCKPDILESGLYRFSNLWKSPTRPKEPYIHVKITLSETAIALISQIKEARPHLTTSYVVRAALLISAEYSNVS